MNIRTKGVILILILILILISHRAAEIAEL